MLSHAQQQPISIRYFIGTFALLLLMESLFNPHRTESLAYSDFKQVLRAGQLTALELKEAAAVVPDQELGRFFASEIKVRVILTRTRPEPMASRSDPGVLAANPNPHHKANA